MLKKTLVTTAVLAAAWLSGPVAAQTTDFPNKPVRIVVPFPPGGVADTVGRPVAEAMSRHLKQSIVVENKGGAGGGIGMAQVAKSKGDGYTVLMSLSSLVVLPEADKILKRAPLYETHQLKPIARFTADPTVLVVRADSPWKTYAEFIAYAKANPGRISFGSSGNYGTMHVPMEQLKAATSTFMLHVPYRGSAGYTQDLLGGELNVGFLPVHIAQGFVKNGRLNALAVGSLNRHPVAPDVPTFDEVGVKRVDVDLWYAFFVPAKTPAAVVTRLNTEMAAILRQNDVKDILGKAGMDAVPSSPAELSAIVAKDHPRWGAVIRTKQISAD